jgi:cyanate permease
MIISFYLVGAHFFLSISVINSFSVCVDIGGDRACTIAGMMNFVGQMGAFAMSILFGKLVDITHNFETPQYLMVIISIVGALLWTGIDASKRIFI